jgi:spermidine synthase
MNLFLKSYWAETKTFFPEVFTKVQSAMQIKNACVVGGADGKFVIPLLQKGAFTTVIEKDASVLNGCVVEFPKGVKSWMPGLYENISSENLEGLAEIHATDFMLFETQRQYDLIFTSCSWHYSFNYNTPVPAFVEKMQRLVKPSGIFAAEYMMPCGDEKSSHPNYLMEGELKSMFGSSWEIITEKYTDVFEENPHVGNLEQHKHRMGFLIAIKKYQ